MEAKAKKNKQSKQGNIENTDVGEARERERGREKVERWGCEKT